MGCIKWDGTDWVREYEMRCRCRRNPMIETRLKFQQAFGWLISVGCVEKRYLVLHMRTACSMQSVAMRNATRVRIHLFR
jgi:hypothetical protein